MERCRCWCTVCGWESAGSAQSTGVCARLAAASRGLTSPNTGPAAAGAGVEAPSAGLNATSAGLATAFGVLGVANPANGVKKFANGIGQFERSGEKQGSDRFLPFRTTDTHEGPGVGSEQPGRFGSSLSSLDRTIVFLRRTSHRRPSMERSSDRRLSSSDPSSGVSGDIYGERRIAASTQYRENG